MNHKMSIRRITSNQRKTPACDLASCRGATGLPPMNDCTQRRVIPGKASNARDPRIDWTIGKQTPPPMGKFPTGMPQPI